MDNKIYTLPDGRRLYVAGTNDTGGETFTTHITHRSGLYRKRYKSSSLPLRQSRQEAQADLDLYARKNKLERDTSSDRIKLKNFDPDPAA